jgi:cytidine deaminase
MSNEDLIDRAREAASNAYAPYSEFRVGAVVIADDGTEYTGANVENAAYGSAICAEGSAISNAASSGVRKLTTVVVACIDAPSVDDAYPCGNCRQLMNEFGVERVIVTAGAGEVREHNLEDLLPYGFKLDT